MQNSRERKPNFVVIFIDDMGYGDIEPFGSTINNTPNLNRMANEGMKLTSFYVAAAVCSPSRAALMTGCYPKRVGLAEGYVNAVLFPGEPIGLHPDEITIADILRDQGYATGCFGKWHLGDQPSFLPTRHGFDYFFGIPYSNDMWPNHPDARHQFPPLPLMRNEAVLGEIKDMDAQAQLCKQFTDEAVQFIEQHQDQPFFVYLPHAYIHHPRNARPDFLAQAKNPDKETGGQIEEVDWSAGEIMRCLRRLDLAENTLVLFTSDNGGARGCVNKPLRGGKGMQFEGGMREPTLAWWPGTIPAGSVCDAITTTMDLLPTFARLAGAAPPQDRIIDGKDVLNLLTGVSETSPYEAFFYFRRNQLVAVRSDDWKLWTKGELYNLRQDIGETTDVSAQHPNVVEKLQQYLDRAREDLGGGQDPGPNCRPVGFVNDAKTILPQ